MKRILLPLGAGLLCCTLALGQKLPFRDLNQNGKQDVYENVNIPQDTRVEDLLNRLPLEDKIGLVIGTGMRLPGVSSTESPEKVAGAAGNTRPVEALGIAPIVLADGPAGLRIDPTREGTEETFYCTAFPIATLVASTWDPALSEEVGAAMGAEARAYGADILLAPALNIHRHLLAGRNFEYFSEDPLLSGTMSGHLAKGVQSQGVGTSIKHFAANNQETNRMVLNAIVSERALREIYLRGFEIAIKTASPWTVMSAYNKINGVYASQHKALLEEVLRKEWGFEGLVMTDWFAGDNAVAQLKAGNDLMMPGTPQQLEQVAQAIDNGELSIHELNKNVRRILRVILQSPSQQGLPYDNSPPLDRHAQLARKVAAAGAVLLKNEGGALPLQAGQANVAAFGVGAYDFIAGGTGSGDVNEAYTVSLVEGLANAGLAIPAALRSRYEAYRDAEKAKLPEKRFFFELLPPIPEMPLESKAIAKYAQTTDAAFVTFTRNSGEFQDRALEADYYLTAEEKNLLKNVAAAYRKLGKPVIVILNIGNVIETASWEGYADAILLPWQGGQEAGNAVADVVTGKVNPSGKLPTSFPLDYTDQGSDRYFPGTALPGAEEEQVGMLSKGVPSETAYQDDIYVGYRYYTSFGKEVAYPFGYGLSYTTFDIGAPRLSDKAFRGALSVEVSVTKTGSTPGQEVVQLYLSAPDTVLYKPARELKAFAKTSLLAPGQSETLVMQLSPKDLASFSPSERAWIAEAGTYKVLIGTSANQILHEARFDLAFDIEAERAIADLKPTRALEVIKP